jgi:hypothetical protein
MEGAEDRIRRFRRGMRVCVREVRKMKQSQLSAICRRWRKRFPLLQPWRIRVRFARAAAMKGSVGLCSFMPEYQAAEILILHPDDRGPSDPDIEADVVHELLHVVIQGHKGPQKYDPAFELGINSMTDALCKAYRRKPKS